MSNRDEMDMEGTVPANGNVCLGGRYRVIREVGRGAMGTVYLAEDLKLEGRSVAVKMLPPVLALNKRAVADLKREAITAMRLSHPHIVTLRSFEEGPEGAFLVMDYVAGRTLEDLLVEKGQLSPGQVVEIFTPLAGALDYAHQQGIVHRDIKPSNILITPVGRPYLSDFGVAREMKDTLTRFTGRSTSGTLPYMSPEQLRGENPSPAQDIYSMAATMYECLAGHPPFYRGLIEHQIEKTEAPPLAEAGALGDAVLIGLHKQSDMRPVLAVHLLTAPLGAVALQVKSTPDIAPQIIQLYGGLSVRTKVAGQLKLDGGTPVAVFPDRVLKWGKIGIGKHRVRIEDEGTSWETEVSVEEDQETSLVVECFHGKLKVQARVTGLLQLDDRPSVPIDTDHMLIWDKINIGIHQLRVVDGNAMWESRVDIEAGKESIIEIDRLVDKSNRAPLTIVLNKDTHMKLLWIPPGHFLMGSPNDEEERSKDEGPQHEVEISNGFWMGESPVTQSQWEAVTGNNPSYFKDRSILGIGGRTAAQRPVESVSLSECQLYVKKLSKILFEQKCTSRLPTEAEWEYACRAGTTTKYYTGDNREELDLAAWYYDNCGGTTQDVRQKEPNAWGLYDMLGNVWEMCSDYHGIYSSAKVINYQGPKYGEFQVVRGGAYSCGPEYMRCACRGKQRSTEYHSWGGFRVVVQPLP